MVEGFVTKSAEVIRDARSGPDREHLFRLFSPVHSGSTGKRTVSQIAALELTVMKNLAAAMEVEQMIMTII